MENKKKFNINLILSIVFVTLFVIWTILVKTVDVSENVGNTTIGLSSMNKTFFASIGGNETLEKITDILFYPVLGLCLVFVIIALIQLIKRKSLLKVDKEILSVLVGYGLVVGIYVLFELFIINYRPVLVEGEIEASYPSSHTLMSTFILLSTAYLINHLFKNSHRVIKNILIIICYILCALMVVFRLLSGVHWLSDIIGGLFISLGLYFAYVGFIEII